MVTKLHLKQLTFLLIAALVSGCASLMSDTDPPKVTLESFRALPSEGGAPRFEMQLRILNPNNTDLNIVGISYTVALLDKELIAGVTNDVPPIEAYGEGVVTLEAGLQLFELMRLFVVLGQEPTDTLEYKFAAKIDFAGLMPTQRIEDTGEFTLN